MKHRDRRLVQFARRISRLPQNRPGSDKTFIHHVVHQYRLHRRAVRLS